MGKKEDEQACLAKALKLGMRQKGEPRRIIKRLEGAELPRAKPERPDFVKVISPTRRRDKGALVGVEHFCVDHYSEPTRKDGGKTANSLGSKERYKMREIYEKGHEALMETGELPEEALEGVTSIASGLLAATKKSSYYSFLHSFQCALDKHLRKANEYKRELKALADGGQRIELAFLVEIHTDFSNMFLRDGREVYRCPPGFMPMFEDVVDLLEKASNRVDHIVLLMGNTIHGRETSLLALNAHNVRGSLRKQRVSIYTYAGEDRFLPEMRTMPKEVEVTSSYTSDKANLNIVLGCTWTDAATECKVDAAFQGLKQAYKASQDGRCCASTFAVHFLSEILMDGIIFWPDEQIGSYDMPLVMMSHEELDAKLHSFEEKWLEE